ncbi:MAG: hypothetical protein HY343_12700 [Lentisphaerae bacterium]|nr:hypothetical protein [Lentisphaerota bacterium]
MNDPATKNELIEITGLWSGKTASGETYFSGSLGRARILIFKNGFKTSDKHPDYRMYITKRKAKDEGNSATASAEESVPAGMPDSGSDS